MYIIHPMLHDEKKLFHVSSHVVGSKNVGAAINASKAKYIYTNLCNGIRSKNERGLTAGLAIAFVNTDYTGWTDVHEPKQYATRLAAATAKAIAIAKYTKLGYTNVGVRNSVSNNTGSGDGGARWTAKFPSSMKQDKIYSKIDWINTSLQLDIPARVKYMAYGILAGCSTDKANAARIGFYTEVDNMATLLMFVRKAMGLV